MVDPDLPPPVALFRLITGHYLSHAVYLAAKLGIADYLANGMKHYEELAKATGSHGSSLNRLMRLLASAGVLLDEGHGSFSLTAIGNYLRSDIPGSRRALALLFAGPTTQRPWAELEYSVRTGSPAFERVFGADGSRYFAEHPQEAQIFDQAMYGGHALSVKAVARGYDFSHFSTVVDVGGGKGGLLISILEANPGLRGILLERPHVIEDAKTSVIAGHAVDRCTLVAGDFFHDVPAGGDAYILKSVLHGWNDDQSRLILKNCRRAMPLKGKLLVVELIFPEMVTQSVACQTAAGGDVNVLVSTTGRERTEKEFQTLFESSGFELSQIIPTQTLSSIIEGIPL